MSNNYLKSRRSDYLIALTFNLLIEKHSFRQQAYYALHWPNGRINHLQRTQLTWIQIQNTLNYNDLLQHTIHRLYYVDAELNFTVVNIFMNSQQYIE